MTVTPTTINQRKAKMRADLEPMTLSASMGYGRRLFGGAAFDNLLRRLDHEPDGSPPNIPEAADVLVAWLGLVTEFVKIIKSKS